MIGANDTINIDLDTNVLPAHMHIFADESDEYLIEFMYGSRDSGKSYSIAQKMVFEALTLPYFRCVLIRELSGSIKDSQWKQIQDVVSDLGLDNMFTFTKSPLEIKCNINKNYFISRGCDEPHNLKSISGCNRAWVEEGVKEKESMDIIIGTLRSNESKVKIFYSFNPEYNGNYHNWWLYKDWFDGYWNAADSTSFVAKKEYEVVVSGMKKVVSLKYRVTHTTYKDNQFCSDERIAVYENFKGYAYRVFTLGLFGYNITGGQFWTGFKAEKHTIPIVYRKDSPFHIVLDSNTAPYVSIQMWQVDESEKEIDQYAELPCRSPHASAAKAARKLNIWLCALGYDDIIYLYADATSNNKSTVDENNKSFFQKFKEELESLGWVIEDRIGKTNPRIALSGDFINDIYEKDGADGGYKIRIGQSNTESIEDYTMAKADKEGRILKKMVKDKETGVPYQERGHMSDCKRYLICWILGEEFEKYGNRSKKGFLGVIRGHSTKRR